MSGFRSSNRNQIVQTITKSKSLPYLKIPLVFLSSQNFWAITIMSSLIVVSFWEEKKHDNIQRQGINLISNYFSKFHIHVVYLTKEKLVRINTMNHNHFDYKNRN
jgi:hypothetical protein